MAKNIDYFFEGPETLRGANRVAREVFIAIRKHHGEDEARRIFETLAKGITKADERRMEREVILERYDQMSEPNVMELARQLEEEGYGTAATVDHRIRELLRMRKAAIAEGTWDGPPRQRSPQARCRQDPRRFRRSLRDLRRAQSVADRGP